MAATDSLTPVAFSTDMSAASSWDPNNLPHVPYPGSIALPDPDIIAELTMYQSAMSTPVSSDTTALPSDGASLPPPSPSKRCAAVSLSSGPPCKKAKSKPELMFAMTPTSPPSSLCTDSADDSTGSLPPTPLPADLTALPALTREHTARRRALRRLALNRARARRDCSNGSSLCSGVKCEVGTISPGSPTLSYSRVSCGSGASSPRRGVKREMMDAGMNGNVNMNGGTSGNGSNGIMGSTSVGSEAVDKKAARAIRNREAAMKSRIEAKQKMRKLQDENNSLAVKVRSLTEEKDTLTGQLRNLLATLGVSVGEGEDVKSVLEMLGGMSSSPRTNGTGTNTAS